MAKKKAVRRKKQAAGSIRSWPSIPNRQDHEESVVADVDVSIKGRVASAAHTPCGLPAKRGGQDLRLSSLSGIPHTPFSRRLDRERARRLAPIADAPMRK